MGQRVQLKDENNNNVYPVIGKRCAICNNNSDAKSGWYKVATISGFGSYTDKYIRLRVVSSYGDLGSGILCIHARSKGDGTIESTYAKWESKTTGGIYPNNYRMNAVYGTDKTASLYVNFGLRYAALRFELLSIEDRSQYAMVTDEDITLYSYINVLGGSLPSTGTIVKSTYMYYVGAVYLTYGSENPENIFGGTWEKQKGGYLYGAVNSSGNGNGTGTSTGSTTLSASQIPKFAFQTPHIAYGEGAAAGITNVKHTFVSGQAPTSVNYEGAKGTGQGYAEKYEFGGGQGHSHNIPYIAVFVWRRTA